MTVTGRAEGPSHERDKLGALGPGTASAVFASSVLSAAQELRAATFEVDPERLPDLVKAGGHLERHLWAKSELTILGCGQALRLPLPAGWATPAHTSLVSEALSAIHTEDEPAWPGSGPLAIGALPYDPSSSGHLVVPRVTLASRPGRAWATVVLPADEASSARFERVVAEQLAELATPSTSPSAALPDRFELGATMPHEDWKDLVARAVKEMEGGSLSKVVLARQVEVVANRPFVLPETLGRLAHLYPSCVVFQVEGFIGASPETLLRRTGAQIESHPLAGTVARSGDPATDDALVAALMSSAKDRHEHQLVVDEIAAKLRPYAAVEVPAAPSIVPLRNVSHLGTSIKGPCTRASVAGRPTAPAPRVTAAATAPVPLPISTRARPPASTGRSGRASSWLPCCSPRRRWAACRSTSPSNGSGTTRVSTVAVMPARWAGSTVTGTANGPSAYAAPRSRVTGPSCTPATASWPVQTLRSSWAKRN